METPMPVVQGFIFTSGNLIPNIGNFSNRTLVDKEWLELQEIILNSGDRLFRMTKRGSNHPAQTKNLRVDYQGEANNGNSANQQAQLGGIQKYTAVKNESTSFTCVHVDFDCQNMPNIGLALQRAHDTSYRIGRVIRITRAQIVATIPIIIAPVIATRTTVCPNCGEVITLLDYQKTGSYIYCPNCVEKIVVP